MSQFTRENDNQLKNLFHFFTCCIFLILESFIRYQEENLIEGNRTLSEEVDLSFYDHEYWNNLNIFVDQFRFSCFVKHKFQSSKDYYVVDE